MHKRKYGKIYYFLVAIKKKCDNKKSSIYKLTFIDSFRFLQTSLSNLVDNVSEIYKKRMRKMHGKKNLYENANLLILKTIG